MATFISDLLQGQDDCTLDVENNEAGCPAGSQMVNNTWVRLEGGGGGTYRLQCEDCIRGRYRSSTSTSPHADARCEVCPAGALCEDGSVSTPLPAPGFYRSDLAATDLDAVPFYRCVDPDAEKKCPGYGPQSMRPTISRWEDWDALNRTWDAETIVEIALSNQTSCGTDQNAKDIAKRYSDYAQKYYDTKLPEYGTDDNRDAMRKEREETLNVCGVGYTGVVCQVHHH